jgi:hypothetical protein
VIRRFELWRHEDVTKVSGTGLVAEGAVFSDGVAVTHWLTSTSSTVTWDTHSLDEAIETLERIHGHGGKSSLKWLDVDDG